MTRTPTLSIEFGALVPPLRTQLQGQASVPLDVITQAQQDADAITRLKIHQILTDGEAHRARQRLLAFLCRHAVPHPEVP